MSSWTKQSATWVSYSKSLIMSILKKTWNIENLYICQISSINLKSDAPLCSSMDRGKNNNTNCLQSVSQMRVLIMAGCNGSVLEEIGIVALHSVTASYSEALIPSPLLCVRQIWVSISGHICACRLNPKGQPLQGLNEGEKLEFPKFSTASPGEKLILMGLLFLASIDLLVMDPVFSLGTWQPFAHISHHLLKQ